MLTGFCTVGPVRITIGHNKDRNGTILLIMLEVLYSDIQGFMGVVLAL